MKYLLIFISVTMFFNTNAQNTVYDSNGSKQSFTNDDLDIYFTNSSVEIPSSESEEAGLLATILPTAIDFGFKITKEALEKRQKKFAAEYTIQQSNLSAGVKVYNGNCMIPNIRILRNVTLKDGEVKALEINLEAKKMEGFEGFYYFIKDIELNYSKAKATSASDQFDYILELKPTFFVESEKKAQELSPVVINSVNFGLKTFPPNKLRTDIIPLPKDGMFLELSIKIIETNSKKVNADKVVSFFNTYSEDAKTIINNIIEKSTKEEDTEVREEPAGDEDETGNE